MKKFTKILSVLCALALIASCISVGFVASAAEATFSYTAKEDFDAQTSYDAYGTNHLASASVSAKATEIIDGVPTSAGSWTPGAGLTDNSPAAQQMIQVTWPSGAANTAKDGTSTNQYLDYTFALPSGVNNPEMVLLAFVQTGTSVNWNNTFFDCRHWAIYASDSAETLYSGEPIFYRQIEGQAAPEYKVDISGLELKNVKYLGVRVYNFYFWGNTVLFSEIGLYGGVSELTVNSSLTSDENGSYETVYGKNNLGGSTITYNIVETTNPTINGSHYPTANIIDGSSGTLDQIQISSAVGSATDYTQTSEYMDVMFELPAPINNPQKFLIAYRNATGESSMHYAIYASSSKDTLFSNEVYEYSSSSNNGQENVIDLSGKNLTNIKYFAIRFYNLPVWGSCVLPREIALYGGKSILIDSATYSDDENNAYNYGANRLAGSTATTTTTLIGSDGNATMAMSADVAILTNGSAASRNQIQAANIWDNSYSFSKASTDKYIQVTFALKKAVNNPSKFLIAHDDARFESNPTVNQWYEIYASDTEADLYENSVFVYKNTSAKMVEQQIDLSDMDLGNVNYFGIRFYYVPTGCFALPSEIALYGGEVVKTASIATGYQNYSKGSAYTTYGQNHLEYAIGEAISTDGTTTKASNVALGSVDGKFTDSGTIAVGDSTILTADNNGLDQTAAYLQLQYTLNAPVDNPQKFVFIHHNSTNGSYNSAHYAVFASDSLSTLYDKALYEFKADAGVGNTHVIDISDFELQNVKYAAIRFYHRGYNNCNQHIEEFGLYGGTMEAGFNTNSTAAFTNTSWGYDNILNGKAVSAVSDNGSAVVPFEDTDNYLAGFTDDKTADDGTGAKYIPGLEQGGSFKVTYDLGGTLDNPTTVNFQSGWGVQKPYTVYASATLEDLYNAENAIVEVAGYTGDIVYRNITTDITEQNLTGIKYIGLKVDATNNTMMHITEFQVRGGTYTANSLNLLASVYNSNSGSNSNDIIYHVDASAFGGEITDMGIIAGFKMNIDADSAFTGDYATYLKANGTASAKVSAPSDVLGAEDLFFQVVNSGTHNGNDYSGYIVSTIAFVTVKGIDGKETTYYSNVITKSSMQISRNQAKAYKEAGYEVAGYESYEFATDGTIDITKVREYVEACSGQDLAKKKYPVINNSRIKTQGRTYDLGDTLGIDFSGAGIEFNAYCEGDVSITVNAGKAGLQFMAVVDGVKSDILLTTAAGENVFTIGSDLAEGDHTFAFYRLSSYSSSSTNAAIVSVDLKGGLTAAPAEKDLRIEVIGDSITCGAGGVMTVTDGTKTIKDYNGETFKRVMIAFAPKAGGDTIRYDVDYLDYVSGTNYVIKLDAERQYTYSSNNYNCIHEFYDANGELLISVPYGTGVTYDENAYYAYSVQTPVNLNADWTVFSQSGATIQQMYDRYLTMYGRSSSAYTPDKKADIVVVNLATNGIGSIENYEEYMSNFVDVLREYHPDCKIVFAYGAMTNFSFASFHNRIVTEVADLGGEDNGIYSFQFTLSRDGQNGHPSMANHLDMAAELSEFIETEVLN